MSRPPAGELSPGWGVQRAGTPRGADYKLQEPEGAAGTAGGDPPDDEARPGDTPDLDEHLEEAPGGTRKRMGEMGRGTRN